MIYPFHRHAESKLSLLIGISAIVAAVCAAGAPQVGAEELASLLRVRQTDRLRDGERLPEEDYETYRRTQAALIKSPFVLGAALRSPNVGDLPLLGEKQDPLAWLSDTLKVELPARSELLRVTMSVGDDEIEQAITLIDAIVTAYMDEIVYAEIIERRLRLDTLTAAYRRVSEEIREKSDWVHRLAAQLGSLNHAGVPIKLALMKSKRELLTTRLTRLDEKLLGLELEAIAVRIKERDDPQSKAVEILAAQIEFVKHHVDDLQGQIHEADQSMESVPGYSGELDARSRELEGLELSAKELKQKIDALELALQAPARVQIVHQAQAMSGK